MRARTALRGMALAAAAWLPAAAAPGAEPDAPAYFGHAARTLADAARSLAHVESRLLELERQGAFAAPDGFFGWLARLRAEASPDLGPGAPDPHGAVRRAAWAEAALGALLLISERSGWARRLRDLGPAAAGERAHGDPRDDWRGWCAAAAARLMALSAATGPEALAAGDPPLDAEALARLRRADGLALFRWDLEREAERLERDRPGLAGSPEAAVFLQFARDEDARALDALRRALDPGLPVYAQAGRTGGLASPGELFDRRPGPREALDAWQAYLSRLDRLGRAAGREGWPGEPAARAAVALARLMRACRAEAVDAALLTLEDDDARALRHWAALRRLEAAARRMERCLEQLERRGEWREARQWLEELLEETPALAEGMPARALAQKLEEAGQKLDIVDDALRALAAALEEGAGGDGAADAAGEARLRRLAAEAAAAMAEAALWQEEAEEDAWGLEELEGQAEAAEEWIRGPDAEKARRARAALEEARAAFADWRAFRAQWAARRLARLALESHAEYLQDEAEGMEAEEEAWLAEGPEELILDRWRAAAALLEGGLDG